MAKCGWQYYDVQTFGGIALRTNLLTALIYFVVTSHLENKKPRLRNFRSEYKDIVTREELGQLFDAVMHFAENYKNTEPRPSLLGNTHALSQRICAYDFEEALQRISTFDFSRL